MSEQDDQQAQQGYLLLADISGYTAFLTGTELEHSHAIIRELTKLIRERLAPYLTSLAFQHFRDPLSDRHTVVTARSRPDTAGSRPSHAPVRRNDSLGRGAANSIKAERFFGW
jgi:hypothetical protein